MLGIKNLQENSPVGSLWRQFSLDPAHLHKWRRWMVRDNPLLRHRHTHRPARAELSLGLDAGILLLRSGPLCRTTQRDDNGARCGGSLRCFCSRRCPSIAVNVTFIRTSALSFIVLVLKTQGARLFFFFSFGKDVEPIHEWQHQESWTGIQLHRQAAGRHRVYVHHSG